MPSTGLLEQLPLSRIAGTAITGAYQPLSSPDGWVLLVAFTNDCNEALLVSYDGGTTDHLYIPASVNMVFDYSASFVRPSDPVFAVKHDGDVPTSGFFSVSLSQQLHRELA